MLSAIRVHIYSTKGLRSADAGPTLIRHDAKHAPGRSRCATSENNWQVVWPLKDGRGGEQTKGGSGKGLGLEGGQTSNSHT